MASTELGDVVLKAIAYNPSDRYDTAEEFFEALESVRSLEPSHNQDYFPYSAPEIQRVNSQSKPEEILLFSNSLPKEETVLSWAKSPFIKRILVHSKRIGIMVALVVTIAIASGIFIKIKSDNQTEPADIEASHIPTPGEETQETLELNLSKKNLKDISSIKDLKRISLLNLDDNRITDISLLEQSLQLEYLSLRNNQVENMDSLAGLEELTYFDGSGNQIRDITAIKDKDKLSVLVLSNNKIQDLSLIKDLENLTMLHLDNNQITQVNGLENLENLVFLNLSNNEIENYTPLYGLEKLEYLILRDTEISEKQLEELKEALPNCEIDHTTKVEEH